MANVRIDNCSGDTITVILDGQEQVVAEDDRVTFDSLEKGDHTLRFHRTRIPLETQNLNSDREPTVEEKLGVEQKSLHTYLDLTAELELNSSKSVITVKPEITSAEGRGLDVIFSSYSVSASGAKIHSERKVFAGRAVEKTFVSKHIRILMFPIGVCAMAIFAIALVSLVCAISGNPINVGGTVFTLPWAIGLVVVSLAFGIYTAVCVATILKTAKKYKI